MFTLLQTHSLIQSTFPNISFRSISTEFKNEMVCSIKLEEGYLLYSIYETKKSKRFH